MDELKYLLHNAPSDSVCRQVVEHYLVGLRAALIRVLTLQSETVCVEAGHALIESLGQLLSAEPVKTHLPEDEQTDREPPISVDVPGAVISSVRQDLEVEAETVRTEKLRPGRVGIIRLHKLIKRFAQDNQVESYIGKIEFHGNSDAELWNEFQRFLLRMPRPIFLKWETDADSFLTNCMAHRDQTRAVLLPGKSHRMIYPGLSGKIEATGLSLSPHVEPFVGRGVDDGAEVSPDFTVLAEAASICLHFLEADRNISNCVENLNRFKPAVPQSEDERQRYRSAILDRFKQVVNGNEDKRQAFIETADLAEAIFSLVYMPPADPDDSWWSWLHYKTFAALQSIARGYEPYGLNIKLQWLVGKYKDVHHRCGKNDMLIDSDNRNRIVVACLRPFIEINNTEGSTKLPGRVIYR